MTEMTDAEVFVGKWSTVWRGRDSDPALYMDLLEEGCPLVNPFGETKREELPSFMQTVIDMEPDIRVEPIRWAATADGVLIEWVNRGTLNSTPLELRGADRYTLRNGKATEGYAYFDPRPFLDAQAAATVQ